MNMKYFPYEEIRPFQDILLDQINEAIQNKTNLVVNAPTGLGKTSASLAAALSNTLDTDKTIFFLTSMHTQHNLALETINDIKKKHGVKIIGVDIIGKQHLCLQDGVKNLPNRDFIEYCKTLRSEGKCVYYKNLKKKDKLSFDTKAALNEMKKQGVLDTNKALNISEKHKVCPYETSLILGKESHVIVTDYYYLFNPKIRENFLNKIGKSLEDAIIIVDEAHNLPDRVKSLATENISNITIKRALSELNPIADSNLIHILKVMLETLEEYAQKTKKEAYVRQDDFSDSIKIHTNYDKLIETLEKKAEKIREEKKQSYLGSIASFLEAWSKEDEGFARIFSVQEGYRSPILTLSYKCLDPSIITKPVIQLSSSTIMMSGTLTPTNMYTEILGFDEAIELNLRSPFPKENRLNLIVPKTSTKFTRRNQNEFKYMGNIITEIINEVPGNTAVFFPSYKLRDEVYKFIKCHKTIFLEKPGFSKHEKEILLEKFKGYKNSGAALLGVSSGSFAEGIDLPGDLLKSVVVVGLPLQVPDLETKALIKYYDYRFNKGWDYGYVFPAFNKTLQSAGRCIRSETDRGVIIFLDERYAWPNYKKCFPLSWDIEIDTNYKDKVKEFFTKK